MTLSAPNNSKNREDYYLPDYELYFFMTNLQNFIENDNEEHSLNVMYQMILNLIINKYVIDTTFSKYKIFEALYKLIDNNKYNEFAKNKLIDLLEQILKMNKNSHQCEIEIPIQNDVNAIKLRLNYITLLYENNIKHLETKINTFLLCLFSFIKENNFLFIFYF